MTKGLQTIAEKSSPNKASIYREFILWTAMPHSEKAKLGLETQGQFAEYYNIDKGTPTRWKERPDFEQRVDAILKMWSTDKTPDVVHSIYRTAVKGNPLSQMLWLQYFKKFNPKKIEDEEKKVEVTENDIRFAINGLPEPDKNECHEYLTRIIIKLNAWKHSGGADSDAWNERPPIDVQVETDTDAPDLSSNGADAVAYRHTQSARSYMGIETKRSARASESNYQSSAWRG